MILYDVMMRRYYDLITLQIKHIPLRKHSENYPDTSALEEKIVSISILKLLNKILSTSKKKPN